MSAKTDSLPVAEKYYGDRASSYDEKRHGKPEFQQDQFVIQQNLKAIVRKGHNVLDVACGTNRISEYIRSLGGKYHGIDISSDMVKLAQEKDPESDIQVADAREIPHPDAKFDLVMTVKFLKWVPDDMNLKHVVEEIARVLKPGGIALLHQKVISGTPTGLLQQLRQGVATISRPNARAKCKKPSEIKTRATDEAVFIDLCENAGLQFKSATMTSPLSQPRLKKRTNAFYLFEKAA